MPATTYVTRDGDMVDEICWRHYGHSNGVTEMVLDVNYRLAGQPLQLPAGLAITLPEAPEQPSEQVVRLWD